MALMLLETAGGRQTHLVASKCGAIFTHVLVEHALVEDEVGGHGLLARAPAGVGQYGVILHFLRAGLGRRGAGQRARLLGRRRGAGLRPAARGWYAS